MRGPDRYSDRDLDEYEEDVQYEEDYKEEENNEEEEPQLTKDQLEYLERRQKLKEIERQKMKKEGLVVASSKDKKAPPRDSFGSFFGPSQPVIAKRVIEESRAMLDLRHISANVSKGSSQQNKSVRNIPNTNTKASESKWPLKPADRIKTKIEKLKEARDYSFLLSGDAEFPAPAKEPIAQQKAVLPSDARSSQVAATRKPSVSKPANLLHAVRDKKQMVSAGRPLPKISAERDAPASKLKSSGEPRKLPTGNAKNGEPRKPFTSTAGNAERRKLPASNVGNGEPRKLPATSTGNGPGRPIGTKVLDQKSRGATLDQKKIIQPTNKIKPSLGTPKTHLPKQQIAVERRYAEQERQPHKAERTTAKMACERPTSTSISAKVVSQRPIATKQQNVKPSKQLPSRPMSNNRPKKRPADDYSDEDENEGGGGDYRSLIRQMFRYDPRKYHGIDEDDSDMEVGFNHIQAEERRSERIAQEEDERELALIEEEERRERERREAKRLKLKHSQR